MNIQNFQNQNTQIQNCPNNCPNKCEPILISVHDKTSNRFRCKVCRKTFVGHYADFAYRLKNNPIKIDRSIQMIKAGLSIRYIAKLNHLSPSTIFRWKKRTKAILI